MNLFILFDIIIYLYYNDCTEIISSILVDDNNTFCLCDKKLKWTQESWNCTELLKRSITTYFTVFRIIINNKNKNVRL